MAMLNDFLDEFEEFDVSLFQDINAGIETK